MVNSRELHQQYNQLYAAFREYIWDYETVECMASLEVAVYQLCPDLTNINKCLDELDYRIRLADVSDPELDDCIDMIYATLDEDDSGMAYCSLNYVEVNTNEN